MKVVPKVDPGMWLHSMHAERQKFPLAGSSARFTRVGPRKATVLFAQERSSSSQEETVLVQETVLVAHEPTVVHSSS